MALLTVVFISNICYLLYGYTEAKFGKYRVGGSGREWWLNTMISWAPCGANNVKFDNIEDDGSILNN